MSRTTCHDSIKHIEKIATIMGVWPMKVKSKFYIIKRTVLVIITVIFEIGVIMELIKSVHDLKKLNEIFTILMPYTNYTAKLSIYIINERIYLELLELLNSKVLNCQPIEYNWPLRNVAVFMNR